jgi:ribulose-bisphosphate carboxylase small chain
MQITQGTFSFLPSLSRDEIAAQVRYALANGWAISVEHTDDPHPRNPYWELWDQPLFDLLSDQAEAALAELDACCAAHPERYVKLIAYDAAPHRQTTALSFIVQRPAGEPGFRLVREDGRDRQVRYTLERAR